MVGGHSISIYNLDGRSCGLPYFTFYITMGVLSDRAVEIVNARNTGPLKLLIIFLDIYATATFTRGDFIGVDLVTNLVMNLHLL